MFKIKERITFFLYSRPGTEGIILNQSDILFEVPKEPISYIFRMNILNSNIHVETCLYVIFWNIWLFKIVCSFPHAVRYSFITWRNPWSLDLCNLFSVTSLLFELSSHVSDGFNSLLRSWIEVTSRFIDVINWWSCSHSYISLRSLITLIINAGVIGIFFIFGML